MSSPTQQISLSAALPAPQGTSEERVLGTGAPPAQEPPAEVLDQVEHAARAHERLRESGRTVRFESSPVGGPPKIELCDAEGCPCRSLSPAEAIDLAAGLPLEEE